MRFILIAITLTGSLALNGCASKKASSMDPFEPFNRKVYQFNTVLDKIFLKPSAKVYKAILPPPVRKSINNFYINLDLIPTIGNDLLQAEGKWAIRDSWRLIINSSLGVGGLFDVAKTFGLPPHSNDLGITLAKWGDKNSPYLVIPFLGPSTLRDGAGWLFQFALYSPYVYLQNDNVTYGLLALRAVDLRSQLLDTDRIMDEALDKYSFMRDSYLQYRNHIIMDAEDNKSSLASNDKIDNQAAITEVGHDYVDE